MQRIVTKKLTSPGQHYAFTTLDEAPLKDSYTRHTTKLVLRLCVTEVEKNVKREKIQVVTDAGKNDFITKEGKTVSFVFLQISFSQRSKYCKFKYELMVSARSVEMEITEFR